MFRKLGGFVSLLSALVCIGVVVLWVRSRNHVDVLVLQTMHHRIAGAATIKGGLLFAVSDLAFEGSFTIDGEERSVAHLPFTVSDFQPFLDKIIDPTTVKFSFLGFKTITGTATLLPTLPVRFSAIVLPYWLVVAITAPIALRGFRSFWIRRQRIRKGLCLGCGYDIRASEGRCPECGRAIVQASPEQAASPA